MNVLDVPEAPRNFVISDINAKSCGLKWEAPLNDGGSPVRRYVVEKLHIEQIASGWVVVASDVKDCSCTVDRLVKDKQYQFR